MPRAGVWLIRLALLHLLTAATVGGIYLVFKAYGWLPGVAPWRAAHAEQMLVGFMVQLVMGVAFWILPRKAAGREGVEGIAGRVAQAHGRLIWIVFALINAGVLLAAAGTLPGRSPYLTLSGRIAEAVAAALFAIIAWNRQRPYRLTTRRALV